MKHWLSLIRADVRYYSRHRRWAALRRALWTTVVLHHISELCQECGRAYPLRWFAPEPLWSALMPSYGGLLCPRCFDVKAHSAGFRLSWVPMVTERDGVATTNWWLDETRDELLMGEADPAFALDGKVWQPQPTWARLKPAVAPDIPSPYPNENRAPESVAAFPLGGEGR